MKDTPSEDVLLDLAAKASEDTVKLLNKNSKAYRELDLDTDSLDDEGLAKTLVDNPKAIKRPIITDGNKAFIGFKEKEIEELFSI